LCAACREQPTHSQRAPAPAHSTQAASATSHGPPAVSSLTAPTAKPNSALQRLEDDFAWSLDIHCADPHLVLAVDYPSAKANQAWLEELLVVAPELAARFRPGTPTYLYRALYGGKRFRPAEPGEIADPFKQAVIARCGDVAACRALAGAYRWLRPTHSSQLFCGLPPPTTSPEQALDTLSFPEERDWSATRVCARYRACALAAPTLPSAAPACDGLPAAARSCVELPECERVRTCVDALEREPKRPFLEAQPRRVAGHAPNLGF